MHPATPALPAATNWLLTTCPLPAMPPGHARPPPTPIQLPCSALCGVPSTPHTASSSGHVERRLNFDTPSLGRPQPRTSSTPEGLGGLQLRDSSSKGAAQAGAPASACASHVSLCAGMGSGTDLPGVDASCASGRGPPSGRFSFAPAFGAAPGMMQQNQLGEAAGGGLTREPTPRLGLGWGGGSLRASWPAAAASAPKAAAAHGAAPAGLTAAPGGMSLWSALGHADQEPQDRPEDEEGEWGQGQQRQGQDAAGRGGSATAGAGADADGTGDGELLMPDDSDFEPLLLLAEKLVGVAAFGGAAAMQDVATHLVRRCGCGCGRRRLAVGLLSAPLL